MTLMPEATEARAPLVAKEAAVDGIALNYHPACSVTSTVYEQLRYINAAVDCSSSSLDGVAADTCAFHVVWDAETALPFLSMDALAVLARMGVTIRCLSLGLPPVMKLIVLASIVGAIMAVTTSV